MRCVSLFPTFSCFTQLRPFSDITNVCFGAETDRDALVALFLSTGSRWRRHGHWNEDYHIGMWYGVQANDERRVERLELGSNKLQGSGK